MQPAKPSINDKSLTPKSLPQALTTKGLHLLDPKSFEIESLYNKSYMAIIAKEIPSICTILDPTLEVKFLLDEFSDVMPPELPSELLLLREI